MKADLSVTFLPLVSDLRAWHLLKMCKAWAPG
jgi:hypothetical protein